MSSTKKIVKLLMVGVMFIVVTQVGIKSAEAASNTQILANKIGIEKVVSCTIFYSVVYMKTGNADASMLFQVLNKLYKTFDERLTKQYADVFNSRYRDEAAIMNLSNSCSKISNDNLKALTVIGAEMSLNGELKD